MCTASDGGTGTGDAGTDAGGDAGTDAADAAMAVDGAPDAEAGMCKSTNLACTSPGECCPGETCLQNAFASQTVCCETVGMTCVTGPKECCGLTSCVGNSCACITNGNLCVEDQDCCQSPGPTTCQGIGVNKQGTCHPLCGEADETCPAAGGCCGAPWYPQQLQCLDNASASQSICCMTVGMACSGPLKQCGLTQCVGGSCACLPNGSTCVEDQDCCSPSTCKAIGVNKQGFCG